jgi:glutamyl-Q tRNA(Asp) synthetase
MTMVTRFAPSPTGYLHLGHAFSAIFAHDAARRNGGRFILRIEDIDTGRCRPQFVEAIEEDLAWLGLAWDEPPRRQSAHFDDYRSALARLEAMDLLYPCFCTRADIAQQIERAAEAPHGPDGPRYPGLCRALPAAEAARRRQAGEPFALRLDMTKATALAGPLTWRDGEAGEVDAEPQLFGDVVLARKDTPTSYHLAVTVDDALQGVTLVTRGADLFAATHVHRLLQALLGLPVPAWHHHRLLTDAAGCRLAKRSDAVSLRTLRSQGLMPGEVRALMGAPLLPDRRANELGQAQGG